MGLDADGNPTADFAPGPEIRARTTIVSEGCRGSLAQQLIRQFGLDAGRSPQTYALGFKELWQLPAGRGEPGLVQHTLGWPLDAASYGGGFMYHLPGDQVYVGYVVGPRLPRSAARALRGLPAVQAPSAWSRRCWKAARSSRPARAASRPVAGSRMPRLDMPGALLAGDAAGTLNFAKIKGIHQAHALRNAGRGAPARDRRHRRLRCALARLGRRTASCARCATSSPASSAGCGGAWPTPPSKPRRAGLAPWTLANSSNRAMLKLDEYTSPERSWLPRTLPPRDRLASVFFASTVHNESQPAHLHVADTTHVRHALRQRVRQPLHALLPRWRVRDGR